jgi:hypothetical protein
MQRVLIVQDYLASHSRMSSGTYFAIFLCQANRKLSFFFSRLLCTVSVQGRKIASHFSALRGKNVGNIFQASLLSAKGTEKTFSSECTRTCTEGYKIFKNIHISCRLCMKTRVLIGKYDFSIAEDLLTSSKRGKDILENVC